MTVLKIEAGLVKQLKDLVQAGYPDETCGLLIGQQSNHTTGISAVKQARNLNTERAHDRYDLDPRDMLAAEKEVQHTGKEIVGVWHSHPDHPAIPSETDRRQAWPGWSYMILSVTASQIADIRSWRLDETGHFIEEEVEI
jgi:proteasome lid subunit RPN8/RPN11